MRLARDGEALPAVFRQSDLRAVNVRVGLDEMLRERHAERLRLRTGLCRKNGQ